MRGLDAVHLGTALQSRPGLTSFVTYDKRLLDAAQTAGLPVGLARLSATGGTVTEPSSGWLVGSPASAASAGHDAWSAAPWTRSFHLIPARRRPYHPTAADMAAAAELVLAALTADQGGTSTKG